MKGPKNPVFSPHIDFGLSKIEYTYIEILKALIEPGKVYSEEEVTGLLKKCFFYC